MLLYNNQKCTRITAVSYYTKWIAISTAAGLAQSLERLTARRHVWQNYNSQRRHFFPRQMTSEERAQKFHTDDVSLPRSG